ncbi:MAG: 3-deoxy-7-phosphoheptulonate synthase [Arsenophonus sp.]|nr:MAG: 3-deoxy-7-phosphoheptulonate synthase [Arsenophonus sp.]
MQKSDELKNESLDNLITLQALINEFPISQKNTEHIIQSRKKIQSILIGKDKRLLVIIGPCSIHDTKSALEYAKKLMQLHVNYEDYLEIVMRTYFEKPRTVIGWKGFISDPELNNSFKINKGLRLARELLVNINKLKLPTATEFLDTIISQYLADLISWGAIGARTTESQIHRQMASALPCPIGFKNSTNGNIDIAINAVRAAYTEQIFLSPNKNGEITIYKTKGNPYGHIIMRGGKHPNYNKKNINIACNQLKKFQLPQKLIIDCSHGNAQEKHLLQLKVAKNIAKQLKNGSKAIVGIMVESFLIEGAQKLIRKNLLTYGQSITDPCLGWKDTKKLLQIIANAVKYRF